MDSKIFSTRLPAALIKRLKQAALSQNTTVQALVNRILTDALTD